MLDVNVEFVVHPDGSRTIHDYTIVPNPPVLENFDFESRDPLASISADDDRGEQSVYFQSAQNGPMDVLSSVKTPWFPTSVK